MRDFVELRSFLFQFKISVKEHFNLDFNVSPIINHGEKNCNPDLQAQGHIVQSNFT